MKYLELTYVEIVAGCMDFAGAKALDMSAPGCDSIVSHGEPACQQLDLRVMSANCF